ncbi:hypothetical protein [Bernardetia sp.]|uniref:hypothetical protein n=1 Tax=Bernardetia sp. TaxID=1937974 RepID=UPI0025BA4B70|nr:hypothetical protein [Bernardetia sp.]
MKQKILLLLSIFPLLFFASFVSETSSEILPVKKQSSQNIKSKTLKSVFINKKQKKSSLKERIALKLIQKKIKKNQKKQVKKLKVKKHEFGADFIALLLILLASAGVLSGIIYLTLGQVLTGILLILGGILLIPLFIIFFVWISIITWEH